MHATLENRDKIVRGCSNYYVLAFDEELYRPLATEGALDNSVWRCPYLFNDMTKLCPMCGVGWVKTEISGVFANFSAQLFFRYAGFPP